MRGDGDHSITRGIDKRIIYDVKVRVAGEKGPQAIGHIIMNLVKPNWIAIGTAVRHQFSPRWLRALSIAAVSILCSTAIKLSTSTPEFVWIPLPANYSSNVAPRSAQTISSKPNKGKDSRFHHAFEEPKQPIFTLLAAISPALVVVPLVEPVESPDLTFAIDEMSDAPQADEFQSATVAASPQSDASSSFVGVWAPTANACSPKSNSRELLPAVINNDGAWAGDVTCRFRRIKQSGNVTVATSTCSNGRQRWTAKVRLAVVGDRLVWSSERGSQSYVRCAPRIVEASARI